MTTLFIDASAAVAMITHEPEDEVLVRRLGQSGRRLSSPLAFWETTAAVARKRKVAISEARAAVRSFFDEFGIDIILITPETADGALSAWGQFGKVSNHPASLNMGDCFAYACAMMNDARLLYKGDDFAHTNLA